MSEQRCTLCGLPVSDPPITDEEADTVFCCTGCQQVYHLLQEMDSGEADRVREESLKRKNGANEEFIPPDNCRELFLNVDGMHCSTCESFVETLADRQPGIYKSEASYASEMVKIYYNPEKIDAGSLPGVISKMGYAARPVDDAAGTEDRDSVARLVIGGFLGIVGLVLYALFLYPTYLDGEGIITLTYLERSYIIGNIFVMTSFILFYTGFPILRGAWVSLSVGRPNMDLLVTIAAFSAYLYSIGAFVTGSAEVYFDVTMAIIIVVSLGNHYERRIKSNKNSLLSELTEKRISHARVQRNGAMETVEISDLKPGERVVVNAGEYIPVDGTVVDGEGVVNESLVTGESIPVSKHKGDRVVSGTILTQHSLTIDTGTEIQSTIDNLVRLMWDIQSSRPGKQRLADRIAAYFVPAVILLGVVTYFVHYLSGSTATSSLLSALAVLIVSCPCALGLATPLAIASGFREALKHQIIFKSGSVFEEDSETDILAFDKTGTLTTGNMQLLDEGTDATALSYARAIEQFSSHPIGRAIGSGNGPEHISVQDFRSYSRGVSGGINGTTVYIGQPEWLTGRGFELTTDQQTKTEEIRNLARVPVAVAWDGVIQSILAVGDQLRPDAVEIVADLKKNGKKIAVITGDREEASLFLRDKLDPDFLFSGARPDSKSEIIGKLKNLGKVAMIGDGSNDAPSLAEADLGIAFGDLTAIAAESAQVVIPGDQLSRIHSAFKAVDLTNRRVKQNLGWAFLYNIVTIPLAIAGLINPLFAALAMAGSSLLVVSNSSRAMNLDDRQGI